MIEISCEEHDKLSAKSQFFTHTIGRVLEEMEVERTPIDTKRFQKLGEVLRDLELAFDSIKQQLVERNEELEENKVT